MVSVGWSEPGGGVDVVGYVVESSVEGSGSWSSSGVEVTLHADGGGSALVGGLDPGELYRVRVAAAGAGGSGLWSVSQPVVPHVPSALGIVYASEADPSRDLPPSYTESLLIAMRVRYPVVWERGAETGHVPVDGVVVQYRSGGSGPLARFRGSGLYGVDLVKLGEPAAGFGCRRVL